MIDRITLLLKTRNISASQFADEIGVQRSSISHVLSGRNKPSLDFIQKILVRYPEINPDWLLFGKGSMNLEYNLFSELTDPVPVKPEALSKAIQRQERPLRLVSEPVPMQELPVETAASPVEKVARVETAQPVAALPSSEIVPTPAPVQAESPVNQPENLKPPVNSPMESGVREHASPLAESPMAAPNVEQPAASGQHYTGAATMAALAPLVEKEVEQITIFYKDRTFVLYKPG